MEKEAGDGLGDSSKKVADIICKFEGILKLKMYSLNM